MTASDQKLCWKCEEEVHPQALVCPYCTADLTKSSAKIESSPPYRFVAAAPEESIVPSPLYSPHNIQAEEPNAAAKKNEEQKIPSPTAQLSFKGAFDQALISILLLLAGTVFFLFSMVLFLYSNEGIFVLRWNANLWPFFFLFSLPLLFFGWRALKQVDSYDA